ncbi:MAG: bifunctional UDP-N-acetylglucosamine pyrophosphorylase / glucosamine-phosphate N-acetyltransferase [Thermoleophilaceae bacterium]|jgi:bifunctional UDP-N-acetylglucosamine pyrophosphorylase/glucosamine-1-phosphate N-acetyltransferase|nr:bifunctional UDP-N-acetylglucosamine pyrophosphorylase / glucosamine-phosphate N-acetyltransferase [Thermoleophilaceae bacterium]
MSAKPTVLIMAAGRGTRMRSSVPKVLHPVCGRPMVEWVIAAAREAGAGEVICITRPGDGVAEGLPDDVTVVEQVEGEGTGSAVLAARDHIGDADTVVTLSGDHPLIDSELIAEMVAVHAQSGAAATILTTDKLDPAGYGRIVREPDGSFGTILETKSTEGLTPEQLAIREINIGSYAFDSEPLFDLLGEVSEEGGERYLTAVFALMKERGLTVDTHLTDDTSSAIGVNTRSGLMDVETVARARILERHAMNGVSFALPDSVVIDAGVEIGQDAEIGAGVVLTGATSIGPGARIGPHTSIQDSEIGEGATIIQSHLIRCRVAAGASVGPFAYLRPDADIGEGAKVGTFVEVKNSVIGAGAKMPHLSYIGDADVGEGANVAAGNITANYDGFDKHRTKIGKGARTGVHTSLVAPVAIGDDAYTGAGSVITEDVPDGALGISRPEQRNVEGYSEKVRKERAE